MGNSNQTMDERGGGGGDKKYGYTLKLPETGNRLQLLENERGEKWNEEEMVRFDECTLSLVISHPCHTNLEESDKSRIYILRDSSVTHLCILQAKVEESLLRNQLSSCHKIPLGRSTSYVVYGISNPPSAGQMGPGTLCLVINKWFDESESREMSEFKVRIEFHSPTQQGMLNEFLSLLSLFRSLSNHNQIQFRNFSHSVTIVILDVFTSQKTMENFTVFCQSRVKRIFYE